MLQPLTGRNLDYPNSAHDFANGPYSFRTKTQPACYRSYVAFLKAQQVFRLVSRLKRPFAKT